MAHDLFSSLDPFASAAVTAPALMVRCTSNGTGWPMSCCWLRSGSCRPVRGARVPNSQAG
jgi:hypothetical protein